MKRIAITAVLLVALAAAASAPAAITILKLPFDSKEEVRQVKKLGGTSKSLCKKNWRDKSSLGVEVRGGKRHCQLETPVLGDAAKPNQIVKVVAKVNKDTHKGVLKATYVGATVRANRKTGYELRIYPKVRRWELLKSGLVLEKGKESKIKPARQKNRLQIGAIGNEIKIKVNGVNLTAFRDQSAEEIDGRGTGLTYGIRKSAKKKKTATAFFDNLKVQLP